MRYSLYKLFIPEALREKIYEANVRRYLSSEMKKRQSIRESATRVELSSVYIANLRVVIDRNALFRSMPKDAVVAQIGVGQDDVPAQILIITQPKRLHLIDAWENESTNSMDVLQRQYMQEIVRDQVLVSHGEPVEEIKGFADGLFDWVFINVNVGCSYEATSKILESCRLKINEGGYIVGSNYARGSWLKGTRYGVIEAVHEFCKKHSWEMMYLTHEPSRQLSYAIRRIQSDRLMNRIAIGDEK